MVDRLPAAIMGTVMCSTQHAASPSRLLPAPPLSRLAAVAVDGATYLIIPALLIPLGLLLGRRGVTLSSLAVNGIGFAFVIAPATAWAAWWEARPRGATAGKRLLRLQVIDRRTGGLPSGRQALVRNLVKITVPWELGHAVALGYANLEGGEVPVWLWVLTAITYGWVLANLVLLLMRSGKPAHDRLARTVVTRAQFVRTAPRAGSQCTADR
jgi:uncharacterized RDD family membrane protein YckC